MAIGLGGGINMGTASVFLVADATGLRRTLLAAQKDMSTYAKRQIATANAVNKAATLGGVSAGARRVATEAQSRAFADLQRDIQAQLGRTQTVMTKAYAERGKIVADQTKLEIAAANKIAAAQKRLAELEAQRAKQQRLANVTGNKTFGQFAATDPRLLEGKALAKAKADYADLVKVQGTITDINRKIASQQAVIANAESTRAAAARRAATLVNNANTAQRNSLDALKAKIDQQNAAYANLAASAGGKYVGLAARVKQANEAMLRSTEDLARKQQALQLARAKVARTNVTGDGSAAAQKEAQTAAAAVERAARAETAARARAARARTAFTNAAVADDKKRAAEAIRAAQQVAEAAERERAAVAEARARVATQAVESAQAGFLALGATVLGTAKQFVPFEEQMVNVAAISEDVAANLPKFTEDIQRLSVELGKSPEELAAGLYEIAQAGFDGQEAMDILALAAKAAVAGQTKVENAARPLIGVINAYGLSVDQARAYLDVMFNAVTEGVFTFEDLSSQIGDNLSLAAALGVSVEELGAAYVVLTKRSNNLSESTTQVNAVMNSFLKPSDALNQAVQDLTGETAEQYFATNDLAEVLALVQQLYTKYGDSIGELFPNIRAIRGIVGLTAQEQAEFNKQLGLGAKAQQGSGLTARVFATQTEASAFQLRVAGEEIRNAAIDLGGAMTPALLLAAKAVGGLAVTFSALSTPVQEAVGSILLGATGILGLVSGVAKAVTVVRTFGQAIATMSVAMGAATLGLTVLAAAFAAYNVARANQEALNQDLKASYDDMTAAINGAADATDKLALSQLQLTTTTPDQFLGLDMAERVPQEFKAAYDRMLQEIDAKNKIGPFDIPGPSQDDLNAYNKYILTGEEVAKQQALIARTTQAMGDAGSRYIAVQQEIQDLHLQGVFGGDQWLAVLEDIDAVMAKNATGTAAQAARQKLLDYFATFDLILKNDGPAAAAAFLTAAVDQMNSAAGQTDILEAAQGLEAAGAAAAEATPDIVESGEAMDDADEAAKALQDSITALADTMLSLVGAKFDFGDPLAFWKNITGDETAGITKILLDLQQAGRLSFDDATQQALTVAAAFEHWDASLTQATEAVEAHRDAMGRFTGIIDSVDSAIGTAEDGYAILTRMVQAGAISQQEANQIIASGQRTRQLAIDQANEEAVAVAKSIPALEKRLDLYTISEGRYDDLTDQQKANIALLQDERTYTILLTVAMLKYMEALGAIPHETVTQIIADTANADPAVAAMLDQYGLLPTEVQTTLIADIDPRTFTTIAEIDEWIAYVDGWLNEAHKLGIDQGSIAAAQKKRDELATRRADIVMGIEVDSADAERAVTSSNDLFVEDTQAAADDVAKAWDEAFASLEQGTETVRAMANSAIPDMIAALRPDLSDPFAFMTQGVKDANKNIGFLLLNFRRLVGLDVDLDADAEEALRFSQALAKTQAALDRVTSEMDEASDRISTYKGYLSSLDEVLGDNRSTMEHWNKAVATGKVTAKEYADAIKDGTARGAFANLTKLVERGLITQQQANQIEASAARLRRESNKAILQEQANLALSIPALEKYVAKHRDAEQQYDTLTDKQRGFVAALEDENTQAVLSNALLMLSLEQAGIVAEGTAKRYIDMARKIQPALDAVFDEIGILDKPGKTKDVPVKVTAKNTIDDAVKEASPTTTPEATVKVVAQEDPETRKITSDSTSTHTVTITVDPGSAEGAARDGAQRFGTTWQAAVVGWLRATTPAISTAAAQSGIQTGGRFVGGMIGEMNGQASTLKAALVGGPFAQIGGDQTVVNAGVLGYRVGIAYLLGMDEGLRASGNLDQLYAAAADAADRIYQGAADELDIRSPSRKGEYLGQMFVDGVAQGVEAARPGLVETGKAVAGTLNDAAGAIRSMAGAPLWLVAIADQMDRLAQSNEALDPGQLDAWAAGLRQVGAGNPAIDGAADSLVRLSDSTQASIDSVTVAANEYSSNLTYVADQIAKFRGDRTPKQFVDMANDIRKLADSSNQLDADRLRDYAAQLRATGDAGLAKTADYLDAMASNVDERARRVMLERQQELADQQQQAKDDLMQAIDDATDDLPDVLRRYAKLAPDTQRLVAGYIAARMRGDTEAAAAEYQRLIPLLDGKTRDIVTAAATELSRRGVPKGFLFQNGDIVRDMAMVSDLANEYLDEASAAQFLAEWNNRLADSYANVAASRGVVDQGDRRPTVNEIDSALQNRFGADWDALTGAQRQAMRQFLGNFIMGNRDGASQAWSEISQFMTTQGQQALYDLALSMRGTGQVVGQSTGRATGQGIAQGLRGARDQIERSGYQAGQAVARGMAASLGIASPSRVTAGLGRNAAESFADAFVRAAAGFQRVLGQQGIVAGQHYAGQFKQGVESLQGGLPTLNRRLGAAMRDLSVLQAERGPRREQRHVEVNAPINVGGQTVNGARQSPEDIAAAYSNHIYDGLVRAARQMQAAMEGAA